MMSTEKQFDTGEITINYVEGPNNGPPLVLLHGLTSSLHAWDFILPRLTSKWHVYACDLRGHGKSGRGDDYRLPAYAHDITLFLRQAVGDPAALIGHSLGALTVLATAAEAPELVRGVVALDPPLYAWQGSVSITPGAQQWFSWVYQTVQGQPTLDEVTASCRAMMGSQAPEAGVQEMAQTIFGVAPGTVRTALDDRLMEGVDLPTLLRRITCPLLLFRGDWEAGSAMRDEDAALVAANVPGAEIVQIAHAGHQLHVEQGEEVWPQIADFLASLAITIKS